MLKGEWEQDLLFCENIHSLRTVAALKPCALTAKYRFTTKA